MAVIDGLPSVGATSSGQPHGTETDVDPVVVGAKVTASGKFLAPNSASNGSSLFAVIALSDLFSTTHAHLRGFGHSPGITHRLT